MKRSWLLTAAVLAGLQVAPAAWAQVVQKPAPKPAPAAYTYMPSDGYGYYWQPNKGGAGYWYPWSPMAPGSGFGFRWLGNGGDPTVAVAPSTPAIMPFNPNGVTSPLLSIQANGLASPLLPSGRYGGK